MPTEPGHYKSTYTNGEAKALIAPMLGCQPEELSEFIIIGRDATHTKLGVFHTMYCSQEMHAHCKAIDLVGEYLQDTARRMHELSPQHGPEEG